MNANRCKPRPRHLSREDIFEWYMAHSYLEKAPDHLPKVLGPCFICHLVRSSNGSATTTVDRKHVLVYRFIWEEATGRRIPEDEQINHHCDNRECINPDHLYLGTQFDNMTDSKRRGRTAAGEGNGRAVLMEFQVRRIRQLYSTGNYRQRELAERFDLSQSQVHRVIRGTSWGHI